MQRSPAARRPKRNVLSLLTSRFPSGHRTKSMEAKRRSPQHFVGCRQRTLPIVNFRDKMRCETRAGPDETPLSGGLAPAPSIACGSFHLRLMRFAIERHALFLFSCQETKPRARIAAENRRRHRKMAQLRARRRIAHFTKRERCDQVRKINSFRNPSKPGNVAGRLTQGAPGTPESAGPLKS